MQDIRLAPTNATSEPTKHKSNYKGKIIVKRSPLKKSREWEPNCTLMLTGKATSDKNLLFTAKA